MGTITQTSVFGTLVIRLLGTWAIVHGLLIMFNDVVRWTSPAYSAFNLMPGSPDTWGVILLFAGALIMWASLKGVDLDLPMIGNRGHKSYIVVRNTGLWIIAIWCFVFAIGFATAAFIYPTVSISAADRDVLICVLAIMMTKSMEPRYTNEKV